MADEHLGHAVSIAGFSGVSGGARRHPGDTDERLILTLYDQEGNMQEMPVVRNRSNEMFQEWLRRFDRYTPREIA